jgi:peptide/nickel transport system permease protein
MNSMVYIGRKLLLLMIVIVGVASFLFVLSRFAGDPAVLMSPPEATDSMIDATRERLGLNLPLAVQFGKALGGVLTLDFGVSFISRQDAFSQVLSRVGASMAIIVPSLLLSTLIAVVMGTYAALHQAQKRGRALMTAAFIVGGIPYFFLAMVLILIFAIRLNWLPATGSRGVASLVLPVTVLTVQGFATLSRLTRGQMIDALGQMSITMAKSKGLRPSVILLQHAAPLAVPPLMAFTGIMFSLMIGSLLILEPTFNYAGIGALLISSVSARDFPTVQACIFVIAILITLVTIAMDALVRLIDPRLRS